MKRLGELLLEKGAIDVNELHTGLEACHRSGGRLGTQLLRFGFVTEKDLLEALSQQYGAPYIPEVVLLKTSVEVRSSLPQAVLRKYQAVPFDKVHGRLMVAMANPRDPAAIEEMAALTDVDIEACVATEAAIIKALEEIEGELVEYVDETPQTGDARPSIVAPDWDELWSPTAVRSEDLLRVGVGRSESDSRRWVATFPGLTPLMDEGAAEAQGALDEETFRLELEIATHRDQVADLFIRFASGYLSRLALFAVHRGKVVGWMARGQSVVMEDVQTLTIPVDTPSVFREPYHTGKAFVGAIQPTEANDVLVQCLGDPIPIEVVVLPIQVKDRTVAFLLADVPGEAALAVPVHELVNAANLVNVAFEILILRKKIQS